MLLINAQFCIIVEFMSHDTGDSLEDTVGGRKDIFAYITWKHWNASKSNFILNSPHTARAAHRAVTGGQGEPKDTTSQTRRTESNGLQCV